MKNKKFSIKKSDKLIILSFVIYLIVILAIFLPGYLNKKGTLYIVADDYQIKYKDGTWFSIIDPTEYSKKDFTVYENNNFKGNYMINYDANVDKVILIDNYKRVKYIGTIFAYSGSLKFEYPNYKFSYEKDDTDDYIIKEALSNEKIHNTGEYAISQKIEIDVDNDGVLDKIYSITGSFDSDDENQEYTILLLHIDDKTYVIDKTLNTIELDTFDIVNLIDMRSDNKLELIYFESPVQTHAGGCLKLYDLTKKKEIHNFCDED